MGLGDITDRQAVVSALSEFDQMGREAFLAKYGFGRARSYFIEHGGSLYDSKAIAGAAHGIQHGAALGPADFSGGDATVAALMRRLGFHVTTSAAAGTSYWWDGDPRERCWVEIRQVEGIGTYLQCPLVRENGQKDPWYELVPTVSVGDVIFHWSVREGRFVGVSQVATPARVTRSGGTGGYWVDLEGFRPLAVTVDHRVLRAKADFIYDLRDELEEHHGRPLNLPFQFTRDRSQLRFMSNYFAKLPAALVAELFGAETNWHPRTLTGASAPTQSRRIVSRQVPAPAFLAPFKPKADTTYEALVTARTQRRHRDHETLVNACALWLQSRGHTPARNAAVDLGLLDGTVIIEAKLTAGGWPGAIRAAIGQLYEYRYFQVARPDAALILLSDQPVPAEWLAYLEDDRGIGSMWPASTSGFALTSLARQALRL
ncbi:hypothetical protein [Kribbella sp. VKM Ac-2566]|uniref:hypothetical protein n=1 Tax=Kribbella sp. VKM Ac-2566 TaxID=2512218 RepID=UPI00192DCF2F|nr:hypothetical protein [Kribbella sp. VKM Ac-2566]